jgi:hypothetical protein
MSGPSEGGAAANALGAIREDQERRNEAKKNLRSALTNYLEQLPRDPAALPASILTLAEIWGAYAVSLYDSSAERYFAESPQEPRTLFCESGELRGGRRTPCRRPRPPWWPEGRRWQGFT